MFQSTEKRKAELAAKNKTTENYAVKFGAFPTKKQIELLNKTFGCARAVYNMSLYYKSNHYSQYKDNISMGELKWRLTHYYKPSEEYAYFKEIDKFALETAIEHLDDAYQRFFNGEAGYPKSKSKHNNKQSYTTKWTNNNIQLLQIEDGLFIKLPKVGLVSVCMSKNCKKMRKILHGVARILSATISRHANRYYISLNVEEIVELRSKPTVVLKNKITAGDLGIKTLMDSYNGMEHTKIENPKWTKKNEKKTRRLQKSLSKKQKGSKNYEKEKAKLAKHTKKVANQRCDFNHKLSRKIVNENQVYISEDLAIPNMVKNHKLSKAILSCGWGQLQDFIKYKMEKENKYFIKVDRFYPSSKTCRHCGHKNTDLTLKDREWKCPQCGAELERDENASENLYDEGIRILESMGVRVI